MWWYSLRKVLWCLIRRSYVKLKPSYHERIFLLDLNAVYVVLHLENLYWELPSVFHGTIINA